MIKHSFALLFPLIVSAAQVNGAGFSANTSVLSGAFDLEIAPMDNDTIRSEGAKVSFISNGTWVRYRDFDFGTGATYFKIEAASGSDGGTIDLRTGSENGPVFGSVTIANTGGFSKFQEFGTSISPSITGKQDLYFKFVGGGGFLFDTRVFSFQSISPDLKQPNSSFSSGNFDQESAPTDPNLVRSESGKVTYITNRQWVAYHGFDFGEDANRFSIDAATPEKGGTVEVRLGSETGTLVGIIDIHHTGSWTHYRPFSGVLSTSVSGVHDLYLRFVSLDGAEGYIFNTRNFIIDREAPVRNAPNNADDDQDGTPELLEQALGMHPESKDNIPLRVAPVGPVGGSSPYDIAVRLRADSAMAIKILVSSDLNAWEDVSLSFLNGAWQTNHPTITISEVIPRDGGLTIVRLKDSRTHAKLFARLAANLTEGALNVYPPVPELPPSPYYTFSVQKISTLNSPTKQSATNWEQPFAWFTRCVDYPASVGQTAYYSSFIGSWSHTYCNFEMAPHTPIVVKITRLNKPGAPSGPITTAAVHPAHKVDACEVINGEVYITMSQPALIAVDIDGQMDSRDTPRATPSGFNSAAFPHRNEMDGVHGVTIFANPFLEDKPQLGDPGVFAVEPGTLPPSTGSWTTLYFKPGIHKLSVNAQGAEREWQTTDPLFLTNHKNYYIPGDAIVYGNMSDLDDNEISKNIRVFGHGTLSGNKIPHWQDFAAGPLPESEHKKLRMLQLTKAENCVYEGITIADPAEHGAYIQGGDQFLSPNSIKWFKNISWRVNNDGGGVTGNGYVEDCFFRHQDDALYVRGIAIRRCVFWSDVNGTPLRCSFINSDRDADFPFTLPQDFLVEDCDIIYARGVFTGSDSTTNGVIGTPSAYDNQKTYADGTLNTGQHLIFRNIRVTDPKPVRYLFGFHPSADQPPQIEVWAGIRFENITFQHPQTWGWRNRLIGTAAGPIKFFSFKNVFIGGVELDSAYLNSPTNFEVDFLSDSIFR